MSFLGEGVIPSTPRGETVGCRRPPPFLWRVFFFPPGGGFSLSPWSLSLAHMFSSAYITGRLLLFGVHGFPPPFFLGTGSTSFSPERDFFPFLFSSSFDADEDSQRRPHVAQHMQVKALPIFLRLRGIFLPPSFPSFVLFAWPAKSGASPFQHERKQEEALLLPDP